MPPAVPSGAAQSASFLSWSDAMIVAFCTTLRDRASQRVLPHHLHELSTTAHDRFDWVRLSAHATSIMDVLELVILVCGVGLGLAAGWGLGRAQTERAHAEHGAQLASEAAAARASLHAERTAAVEREARLEQTDERLRATFAALSADALRTNNHSFLELAQTSLAHY